MTNKIVLQHVPCPKCPSSDAYCEYEDGHGYCFSCTYYKPKHEDFDIFTYEYLPWRGITKQTMEFYDVRTKIDGDGKPIELGFRYPSGAYKVRSRNEKLFRWN